MEENYFSGRKFAFPELFFIVYNGNTKTQRDSQPPSVNFSLRDILLIKNVLFLRTARYMVCLQKKCSYLRGLLNININIKRIYYE